jgi:hypothetical protein
MLRAVGGKPSETRRYRVVNAAFTGEQCDFA